MSDFVVVDNFFHKFEVHGLSKLIFNNGEINWKYGYKTTYNSDTNASFKEIERLFIKNDSNINVENDRMLTHPLILHNTVVSDMYNKFANIKPLIESKFEVNIKFIQEMKINFSLPGEIKPDQYLMPHYDNHKLGSKTMILYMNDCEGDTILFNEYYEGYHNTDKKTIYKRYSPKINKAIMFDARRYHSNSFSTKNIRAVIVANIII